MRCLAGGFGEAPVFEVVLEVFFAKTEFGKERGKVGGVCFEAVEVLSLVAKKVLGCCDAEAVEAFCRFLLFFWGCCCGYRGKRDGLSSIVCRKCGAWRT